MVSYRFCRPDDLPLIAAAIDSCYNVHFAHAPTMDLERLKREAQELNVWASSCMVGLDGGEPVAVMVGAKREGLTLIKYVGARPGHQGRGHVPHMLHSLNQKLAIIGPPTIVVEVPDRLPHLRGFFERAGFGGEEILTDFTLAKPPPPLAPTDAIQPVGLDDVLAFPDLWRGPEISWTRARETLLNRKSKLSGLALVSPDRVEAFLLYRGEPDSGVVEIDRFGTGDFDRGLIYQGLLLRALCREKATSMRISRLHETEMPASALEKLGFRVEARYWRGLATAGDWME